MFNIIRDIIIFRSGIMVHKMKLVDFAFNAIKNKVKTIEVRLNDEKRQLIKVGDIIEFTHVDSLETLKVKVINIYKFKTFKELFEKFSNKQIGLLENEDYTIMDKFYTKEEQEKYGAIGIEISLL